MTLDLNNNWYDRHDQIHIVPTGSIGNADINFLDDIFEKGANRFDDDL